MSPRLERTGSSKIVSNIGFLDLETDILYLCSSPGKISKSSVSNFIGLSTHSIALEAAVAASFPTTSDILTFPPPDIRLATSSTTAISAAMTIELSLLIGNIMYKLPNSKSSSADRAENPLPIFKPLEFTKK
ncbi:hypothetical protein Leryth_011259 [Lithospermum erythrorhizon]|nr:hypothetical protein Leryth_011259 [Lithospermum erythrorhizon]